MSKRIHIITLFPEMFAGVFDNGVIGSALRGERGQQFEINFVQLRDHSPKDFKGVDDAPYGGGQGMVMRADVLKNALENGIMNPFNLKRDDLHVVYTSPRGKVLNNIIAREFGKKYFSEDSKELVFICGRYEGIDERFLNLYVDEQFSIGDYVLTGGELAVMILLDSTLRFAPGVLGNKQSANEDSFEDGLIEGPVYTRPAEFEGEKVPEVLTSGNHKKIDEHRLQQKLEYTKKYRPDLFENYQGQK